MLAPVLMAMLLGAAPTPPAGRPLLVTVDDLPVAALSLHPDPAQRERITRGLLAVLKKHHIQAVGLVNGAQLKEAEQTRLLDLWLADGHELGNHSYSHPSLTQKSAEDFIADVEQERALLVKHLASRNKTLRFFRVPVLREGETLEKLRAVRAYLVESKQRALPVTIDNQDWSFEQPVVQGKPVSEEYQEALHVAVRTAEARGDKLVGGVSPQLSFEFLETRLAKGIEYSSFGDALASRVHGVSVVARWTLAYPDKAPATGLTLLVLHRRSDGWEIIEDASM
jgi:peptidoglycan/xylan/chitin deacetylase (PgdA/CDA1 family)